MLLSYSLRLYERFIILWPADMQFRYYSGSFKEFYESRYGIVIIYCMLLKQLYDIIYIRQVELSLSWIYLVVKSFAKTFFSMGTMRFNVIRFVNKLNICEN